MSETIRCHKTDALYGSQMRATATNELTPEQLQIVGATLVFFLITFGLLFLHSRRQARVLEAMHARAHEAVTAWLALRGFHSSEVAPFFGRAPWSETARTFQSDRQVITVDVVPTPAGRYKAAGITILLGLIHERRGAPFWLAPGTSLDAATVSFMVPLAEGEAKLEATGNPALDGRFYGVVGGGNGGQLPFDARLVPARAFDHLTGMHSDGAMTMLTFKVTEVEQNDLDDTWHLLGQVNRGG